MTDYTIDVNGKRYELNERFRESIEERARHEYEGNSVFSCWWQIAKRENYTKDAWQDNIHEDGDPVLVIETTGTYVPWEDLDQLEVDMADGTPFQRFHAASSKDSENSRETSRTHFGITPDSFNEVPSPDGEDADRIPPKPRQFDEPTMVCWVPESPDIDHTWAAGEAIVSVESWVEWNVQARADQPRPTKNKNNSHDHWESMLKMHDCNVIGELQPKQSPKEKFEQGPSGSVERKGKKSFEDGRFGGANWGQ